MDLPPVSRTLHAPHYHHRRTQKRVEIAKKKARSELSKCGWEVAGYALQHIEHEPLPPDNIERVDASRMTVEEFVERYERVGKPVILTGLMDQWLAWEKWTLQVCWSYWVSLAGMPTGHGENG